MTDNKHIEIERLIKVRMHFGLSSKDFASKAGIDPSNYSSIETGKRSFGNRVMQDICNAFDVNIDWLRTGQGEMLKSKCECDTLSQSSCEVLLLPISAQGGSLNDFIVSVKDSDCERIVSPIRDVDFAMSVSGDSMSPEYPSGSQILIKRINEKAFIDWGRVYVLDTCNGTVIKRLMPPATNAKETVRCVSINPEYPPFEVSLNDVYGVYKVLLCMSIK